MTRPHVSHTQLDLAFRCPEAYRRRYPEGQKLPPGIAMMKGTALDRAASGNFRQKIESHQDLPATEIVEMAVSALEEVARGEFVLTEEESSRGASIVLGEAKDAAADFAAAHAMKQAPEYQPVMVQQRVTIPLPNAPRDLVGIIDLADDQRRVVDFKTTGKRKNQSDADTSLQLTVYAAAHIHATGQPASGVRLDTLVSLKRGVERQALDSTRGPADFQVLAHRMNAMIHMLEAGVFMPAPVGSWYCSPKWCGYWRTCKYVNSERKAAVKDE